MKDQQLIPNDIIMNKIYYIRNQKVMLDSDLAQLYGVETKRLKEQVKRNINRFPERFMFELTKQENESLRSHFATLAKGAHSKYLPFVFTEHGILMLANVLKSEGAVEVSIQIIDIFVKLRESLAGQTELWLQIEKIKTKLDHQGENLEMVFHYLDQLIERKAEPRKRIGYKSDDL